MTLVKRELENHAKGAALSTSASTANQAAAATIRLRAENASRKLACPLFP